MGQAASGDRASETAAWAARLKHDLGKAIRLSAPARIESDTEQLRERLRSDVAATRSDESGSVPASRVFDEWERASSGSFDRAGATGEILAGIAAAIEEIRGLERRIGSLGRAELERLDAWTREVASGCGRLAEAARAGTARRL
jgi:hypothetical protein